MEIDVKNILNDPSDDEFWRGFFKAADTGTTSTINVTRVAAEIYLAKILKTTGITIQSEVQNTAKKLQEALADHATALNKSAEAANRHAKGLKWATWALVLATFGLIIATLLKSI